jgi:methyl-accepting chemotaxis protein
MNLFGIWKVQKNNHEFASAVPETESPSDVNFDFIEISSTPELYFTNKGVLGKVSFFVDIFNKFVANMFSVANISAKFAFYTKNIVGSVHESNENIESIKASMSESVNSADRINESVAQFAQFIDQTNSLSKSISQTACKMTDATNETKQVVDENIQHIENLNSEFDKIISIADTVNKIAGIINILSLNATIEAARAGEHGKSFAVVADEIKKLAVQTQDQAKSIEEEINGIVNSIGRLNGSNQTIKKAINQNMEFIDSIAGNFSDLDGKISQTETMINSIATNLEEQSSNIRTISDTIDCFSDSLKNMDIEIGHIEKESGVLIDTVNTSLNNALKKVKTKSFIEHVVIMLEQAYKEMVGLIESSIEAGVLTRSDIWDDQYIPVPNTNPARCKTHFTDFFKSRIQPLEDRYLNASPNFSYFVMIDRKGYIPAHNSIYEKPSTGIYEKDVANRSMRIFDDPFNLSIARNTDGLRIQTYARDTGEVMTDISTSVFIQGKHWGCLRVGVTNMNQES